MEIQTFNDHLIIIYRNEKKVYVRELTDDYIDSNYTFGLKTFSKIVNYCNEKKSYQLIQTSFSGREDKGIYFIYDNILHIEFAITLYGIIDKVETVNVDILKEKNEKLTSSNEIMRKNMVDLVERLNTLDKRLTYLEN
jgi:hypothetical protein